jgi:hypothetical protein
MFKDTCLIAHKRIDRIPCIIGLEIPWIAAAPERDHLTVRTYNHSIIQNVTNMYYECMKWKRTWFWELWCKNHWNQSCGWKDMVKRSSRGFSIKLEFSLGIQNWLHKEKGCRLGPHAVNHSLARSMVNRSPWPALKLVGVQPLAAPVTERPSWQQEEVEGRPVKLSVGRSRWRRGRLRPVGNFNRGGELLCDGDAIGARGAKICCTNEWRMRWACHFIGWRQEATGREGGGRWRQWGLKARAIAPVLGRGTEGWCGLMEGMERGRRVGWSPCGEGGRRAGNGGRQAEAPVLPCPMVEDESGWAIRPNGPHVAAEINGKKKGMGL